MSFLGFGARPQPTSAEKLAMAEMEMDIMAHMINKYACLPIRSPGQMLIHWVIWLGWEIHASKSA